METTMSGLKCSAASAGSNPASPDPWNQDLEVRPSQLHEGEEPRWLDLGPWVWMPHTPSTPPPPPDATLAGMSVSPSTACWGGCSRRAAG